MQIVAIIESDDFGPVAVMNSDYISVFKYSDFYLGASKCAYRGTPITCELSKSDADKLIENGVNCIEVEMFSK